MHDETLRIYRATMHLNVEGFVLAASAEEAEQAALAGKWCFSPIQVPVLDTLQAKEEPIEKAKEAPSART